MKTILGICGSTNTDSSNWKLLRHIQSKYVDSFRLIPYEGLDQLPHFNPTLSTHQVPDGVLELRQLIQEVDGVLFCTPEYVFSLPGSLKNLIEWLVSTTLMSAKPTAMIVAASSGAKAFESLGLILTTIECILPEESRLLIKGVKGKFMRQELVDPVTIQQVDQLIDSLELSMNQLSGVPTKYQ